ncbi:hypothetical protein 32HC_86 [Mycobacterium phage 32HC]|uniref:Uncharacterized protein n=1 Tax=Mycobacterium phage 32HC TaxID=1445729 RepID=W8E8W7_9CAUD|nr:hypothetical protein ST32HC_86 [Mycobacterium phage 32HC]AHJ86364.1 hypothetical protein 32HC_86 [Mycobacterium phage 32HC]
MTDTQSRPPHPVPREQRIGTHCEQYEEHGCSVEYCPLGCYLAPRPEPLPDAGQTPVRIAHYDDTTGFECGSTTVYIDHGRDTVCLPGDYDGEIDPGTVPELIACLTSVAAELAARAGGPDTSAEKGL